MLAVHDDPPHRVPRSAVLVEYHLETLRSRHVPGRAVADLGELALARGDERAEKKVPVGKVLAQVRRYGRRLARSWQDGNDRVGILARDVEPAVVAEFHVKRVD